MFIEDSFEYIFNFHLRKTQIKLLLRQNELQMVYFLSTININEFKKHGNVKIYFLNKLIFIVFDISFYLAYLD